MSYMHINNLYKDLRIFNFKECYALEKIHGTSSHIAFKYEDVDCYECSGTGQSPRGYGDSSDCGTCGKTGKIKKVKITFFSGGAAFQNFVSLFNKIELEDKFIALGHNEVKVYGEAYGGKLQGMSHTYGPNLKFVGFEVQINETWLNVENAADVCKKLGLDFVDYVRIPTTLEAIDVEKIKPSAQAIKNGVENPLRIREGIVIRPIEEYLDNRGNRIITKHKNEWANENKTNREVTGEKLEVLNKAQDIAQEWVNDMRLEHVLDAFPEASTTDIPKIIEAMYQDVIREAEGEIIESKDLKKAIYTKTAVMFKKKLVDDLNKLKQD